MKLPSFKALGTNIRDTFLRFPIAILIAVSGTVVSYIMTTFGYDEYFRLPIYRNILLTLLLGIPLSSGLKVFCESKNFSEWIDLGFQLIGIAFLVGFYFSLPEHLLVKHYIWIISYILVFHLFLAFSPFFSKGNDLELWQFNRTLFLRTLTAVIYSMILYLGLVLALAAIDHLLGIDINDKWYLRIFIFVTGIFSPVFILSGIPGKLDFFKNDGIYPIFIKVLSQYILMPLVMLYVVIMYLYTAKIAFSWEWPIGWVSYLVSGLSFTGFLAFLFIYPVVRNTENKVMLVLSKIFLWAVIPLSVLMFMAVMRRISDYGITENRYFLIVEVIFIFFTAIWLLISRMKQIKFIPVFISALIFLSSFGPWGAFSISLNNQLSRFEDLLEKNGMLKDGKFIVQDKEPEFNDTKEICSIVDYICDVHGYKELQEFYNFNLDSMLFDSSGYVNKYKLIDTMGIQYISRWQDEYNDMGYFSFYPEYNDFQIIRLKDFDYSVKFSHSTPYYEESEKEKASKYTFSADDSMKIEMEIFDTEPKLYLYLPKDTVSIDLQKFIDNLQKEYPSNSGYDIPAKKMSLSAKSAKSNVHLIFSQLSGNFESGNDSTNAKLNYLTGEIYFRTVINDSISEYNN